MTKAQYSIIFRTGSFFLKLERGIFSYWSLLMPCMRCMQYGSPLLEVHVLSPHIQRLTVSRSSHSSVKFNVHRRILDCVAGVSHSAPQHTHHVSTLH